MAVFAAFFCALFVPWTTWMQIFLVLVVLDYITGFLAGCMTGTLDSDIAWKGVLKKVATIFVAAFGVVGRLSVYGVWSFYYGGQTRA